MNAPIFFRRCRPDDSPDFTPACSGPCEQGDKECKTPDACRLPDGTDALAIWKWPAGVVLAVASFAMLTDLLS